MTTTDLSAFKTAKNEIDSLRLKDEEMKYAQFFAAGIKYALVSVMNRHYEEVKLDD